MVNSKVVLIVDEDKINRNVLAKILQDAYTIILAGTGKEAIKILKTNFKRIAAIIIDLEMNTMDGYKLLKDIHETSDYSKIPIIASARPFTSIPAVFPASSSSNVSIPV